MKRKVTKTKVKTSKGTKPVIVLEYIKPMEKEVLGLTRCLLCGRTQEDRGQRNSCNHCGMSPLPSKAYPKGHRYRIFKEKKYVL